MGKVLRVLNVEDSKRDAALLMRHLSAAGYELITERVDTPAAMKAALGAADWDIILCDYSLPHFNALSALTVLHQSGLDIPLIILSGTVGEEVAVEAMLTGANDYLPKDNLTRLVPAIERELHAAENRRHQRQADNERSVIFEIIQGAITTPNLDKFLKLVHRSIDQIVYAENCFVMLHDPITDAIHFEFWVDKHDAHPPPKSRGTGFASYVLRTGMPLRLTKESKANLQKKGDAEQIGSASASWLGVPLRTPSRTIGVLVLQHYEEENAYSQHDLEFLSSVGDQIALAIERKRAGDLLRESEELYRDLVENAIDIIYTRDLKGNYTSVNRAAERITGYTREESLAINMAQTVAPEYREKAKQMVAAELAGDGVTAYELEMIAKDGSRVAVEVNTRVMYENGVPIGVQGIARDITERKRAKDALKLFRALVDQSNDTIEVVDPETGRFLDINEKGHLDLGYSREEYLALSVFDVDPTVDRSTFPTIIEELRKSGVEMWEGVHRRKDGSTFPVEVNLKYVQLDRDYVVAVVRDITERKQVEEALQQSEERFRSLFDSSPDPIWIIDDHKFVECNNAAVDMLGYPDKEALSNTHPSELSPEFQPDGEASYSKAERMMFMAQENGLNRFEWVHRRFDKSDFYAEVTLSTITLQGRQVIYCLWRDITAKKQAEEAIRESEIKYRTLFDGMMDGVYRSTHDGRFVDLNDAMVKMFGYSSKEEMLQLDIANDLYFAGSDRDSHFLDNGIEKVEIFRMRRKDGSEVWVEDHGHYVHNEQGDVIFHEGTLRDITDRKRADEELRESEEKYRTILENIEDGYYEVDVAGNFTFFNNSLCGILGYSRKKLLGMNNRTFMDDENARKVYQTFNEVYRTGKPAEAFDWEVIRKDGNRRFAEATVSLRIDSTGQPIGFRGIVRDITERKRVDEAVRESEERFSGAFEFAAIGVALVMPDGRWLKVNRALCEMIGYSEAELLKSSFQKITHPDDLEDSLENVRRTIAGEIDSYQSEKRWIHANGSLLRVLINISLVRDGQGQPRYFIAQIQDITKRIELEEQFRQSQKMEAVGVLAGGIAHDFNNLLTAITGYSELTLRRLKPDDPLRQNIEEIKNAGTRAADLTGQLLAFSRKQVLNPIVHNINSVISNIEKMLRRIIKENIELRTTLAPDLGNIKADPGQIEQVIMNLAINARDAMPGGGRLTIETQNIYLDDDYVSRHTAIRPGPFVKLIVTDSGTGMGAETQQHIFEPFFTTKEVGKGTGLGLSTVYGIVKQSGGDLMVSSEIGHGTTFEIYFPCVDENVQRPKWIGDIVKDYSGTETILLVEDEELVRNLVSAILTSEGYRVLEAAGGEEALLICESYSEPIHMLVTDVVMPRMGGGELRERMKKLAPGIKALFMSGYTDDSIVYSGVKNSDTPFIEKPFTPDALARKVREVLES